MSTAYTFVWLQGQSFVIGFITFSLDTLASVLPQGQTFDLVVEGRAVTRTSKPRPLTVLLG